MLPENFTCHESMSVDVRNIFSFGEYEMPIEWNAGRPVEFLDIGANMGAFAVWARYRWPVCTVTCYEPNPEALPFLYKNTEGDGRIQVVAAAVTAVDGQTTLYSGAENMGQAGLSVLADFPTSVNTAQAVAVRSVAAKDLPPCDLLKVDTEGSEVDIITNYDLSQTMVVMYEWHRRADKGILARHLEDKGFELYSEHQRVPWLGTARWVRRSEKHTSYKAGT